jgi:hypothetical protein
VKLSLKDWRWKLATIDLPDPMTIQLAQELVKQRGGGDQADKKD